MGSRPATGGAARSGAGRCARYRNLQYWYLWLFPIIDMSGNASRTLYCTRSYSYVNQKMMIFFTAGSYSFCIRRLHLHYWNSRSINSKDIALSLQCCETKGNFDFSANKSLRGETVGTAVVATKRSIPQMLLAHLKEVVRKANSFCAQDLEVTISSR